MNGFKGAHQFMAHIGIYGQFLVRVGQQGKDPARVVRWRGIIILARENANRHVQLRPERATLVDHLDHPVHPRQRHAAHLGELLLELRAVEINGRIEIQHALAHEMLHALALAFVRIVPGDEVMDVLHPSQARVGDIDDRREHGHAANPAELNRHMGREHIAHGMTDDEQVVTFAPRKLKRLLDFGQPGFGGDAMELVGVAAVTGQKRAMGKESLPVEIFRHRPRAERAADEAMQDQNPCLSS